MRKEKRVTMKPSIQTDGAALIEIWTDAYPTWKDFLEDRVPLACIQMTREGIRRGYYTDLRLIEFFRTSLDGKDIDYRLMRKDGTVIEPTLPEGYEINIDGLPISYLGPKVYH